MIASANLNGIEVTDSTPIPATGSAVKEAVEPVKDSSYTVWIGPAVLVFLIAFAGYRFTRS